MAELDQEKISFITDSGTYCYTAMPFSHKNAGTTYQMMVKRVFWKIIKNDIEAYVDDMVVKSAKAIDHVACLQKVFDVARHNNLKFNPEKCVFGTVGGKFLGFMITQRGIEVNPDKIQAILEMKSPTSKKEVQRLIGRVAALNRFMSRAADKCYHFFKAIGDSINFEWTQKCKESLESLKKSLQQPPILTSPCPSNVLSRKLRPYFQSYTVQVLTDQPIKQILYQPKTSERLQKWEIEISELDIEFRLRTAIKAQGLVNFIVELTISTEPPEGQKADWKIFFPTTNNDAEYEAVITGFDLAARLGVTSVEICSDSQLIVGQVSGEYEEKDGRMAAYLMKVRDLQRRFASFKVTKVSQRDNECADALAKLISPNPKNLPRTASVQVLQQPIIQPGLS
ncbi:uncharacterized protein LOC111385221 [Olea europaea var. sylvestris]|uniref:uncharacterized protein LOC111385221 n=1 Tax=Olea europaea var. sylvestris TaxID=158386 RepID=UPI000C1D1D6C|nr:uncharacterized protein LOC111385221 [Olea europaea var. sylvestris]